MAVAVTVLGEVCAACKGREGNQKQWWVRCWAPVSLPRCCCWWRGCCCAGGEAGAEPILRHVRKAPRSGNKLHTELTVHVQVPGGPWVMEEVVARPDWVVVHAQPMI